MFFIGYTENNNELYIISFIHIAMQRGCNLIESIVEDV